MSTRSTRRAQVQTHLNPLESLLLAQATWELGAGPNSWQDISKILSKHPLLSRPKSFFTAQSCQNLYEQLMKDAELEIGESNNTPHAPMNLKLAERHFQSRHAELRDLILTEESRFKTILKEIEDIRAGLWDKKIEATQAGDNSPNENETSISDQGGKTAVAPSQSLDEIFDGSELSGLTESAESVSSSSLLKDSVNQSGADEDKMDTSSPHSSPARSLTPHADVASCAPPTPTPVGVVMKEPVNQGEEMPLQTSITSNTPGTYPEVVGSNNNSPPSLVNDVDMEPPQDDDDKENFKEESSVTEPLPPKGESESDQKQEEEEEEEEDEEEEEEEEEEEGDDVKMLQDEDKNDEEEIVVKPAEATLVETESEIDEDIRSEKLTEEKETQEEEEEVEQAQEYEQAQEEQEEEQEHSGRVPTPAAETPASDTELGVNEGNSSGSEEEQIETTRRSTRRRKSSVTLGPPVSTRKRLRSQGRISESEQRVTVDTDNDEDDEVRDEDTPQPEDEVSSPFDGVMTRRRDSKRKASFIDGVDSPSEKKRMREDSEPVDEDEPGPSSHNTRGRITRQGMRTEEQVALKRFQNVIGMLHSQISQHRNGNIFHNPIKNSEAPDYHEIVKRPMDLKTIKTRVKDGLIANSLEFQRDIFLMFANSMMYNRPGSDVYTMAEDMMLESEGQIIAFRQTEGMVKRGQRP